VRLGVLERAVGRRAGNVRSEFSRFLSASDEALKAGVDLRVEKVGSLRGELEGFDPGRGELWRAEHVRARLEQLEAELVDIRTEQDQRQLAGASRQLMVASGRDLELVRDLRDQGSALERLRAQVDEAVRLREANPDHPLYELNVQSARSDLALYERMQGRTDWSALTDAQVTALVLVERKAVGFANRERTLLVDNLRDAKGDWDWAKGYPVGSDEEMNALLDSVHAHMHRNMSIATNFHLDFELNANRKVTVGGEGRRVSLGGLVKVKSLKRSPSLLDRLVNDPDQVFRNAWETGASQAAVNDSRRGGVEEHFGYAASLGRAAASKELFQDTESDRGKFKPVDPGEMPKYGALVSHYQTVGVAPRYGAFVLRWDQGIRGRVTHTPKDSWSVGQMGARSVTSDAYLDPLLNYGDAHQVRLAFGEATDFAYDEQFGEQVKSSGLVTESYFETQIHGRLQWSDLRKITINHLREGYAGENKNRLPTPERAQELKTILEQHARDKGYTYTVELRYHDAPPTEAPDRSESVAQQPAQPGPSVPLADSILQGLVPSEAERS
jgi:hypothetical protein